MRGHSTLCPWLSFGMLEPSKAIEQLKTQMHDLYFVNSSFIEI